VIRILLAAVSTAALMFGQSPADLPNFKIVNEHILRGGQPSDGGFKQLSERGVKTVVDLRWVDEHSIPHEKQVVEADGMRFVSVPMKGLSAPTEEQIAKVLNVLEDSESWPVFIHCRRGADRTGTVLACYRISHDRWENQKALQEAKTYGLSAFERGMRTYIAHFKPVMP
jgi:tyrosine-protein phosphatase SIW14